MFVKDCESVVTSRKSGFSLVEVLAGLLAASVLALTAGTMLFHAYDGWSDNHTAVNLQRDGRNAMDLMTRAIRNASSTNVVIQGNNRDFTMSRVVMNSQSVTNTVRFWRSGRNLIYDPDTSTGGDNVFLVRDGVGWFRVRNRIPGMIDIVLRLAQDDEEIRLDAMVGFRNQ